MSARPVRPGPVRRAVPWRGLVGAAAVGLLLAAVPVTATQPSQPTTAPERIEVQARPIDGFHVRAPERRLFGALEFRGGLELTSSDKRFGGLSGLHISPDGARFLALSDRGRWLRGRIVYGNGVPVDLGDVEVAPVLGPDGRPATARGWYDTEAFAEEHGTVFVGIERVHRILRFDVGKGGMFGKEGLVARGRPIAAPPAVKDLPSNKGIEGLVAVPKGAKSGATSGAALGGALLAISEAGLDEAGNIRGFIIGGPSPGTFAVRRRDDFDISDATLLSAREVLLLERRFSYLSGVAMRIRRVPLADIRPGALVDGPVLLEADLGYQIDNMEGIAVHRNGGGETVLTLVSDDNFSAIQRTVLLQFVLVGP